MPANESPVIGRLDGKPSGGPAGVGTDASLPKRNNERVIKERWIFLFPHYRCSILESTANGPRGGNSHNRAGQEKSHLGSTWPGQIGIGSELSSLPPARLTGSHQM